jgi:hypothetical protein
MDHAGSCLVDRRAMPPLTTEEASARVQRKRREHTLLTLLTLCEAYSSADADQASQGFTSSYSPPSLAYIT